MDKQKTPKHNKKLADTKQKNKPAEIGGYRDQGLPEPTRYGDWEVRGRCSDF